MAIVDPPTVRHIRIMYRAPAQSNAGALVGLELRDSYNRVLFTTQTVNLDRPDCAVKDVELEEHERIIGVRSSRRGTAYHFDLQFVIGRLE